MHNILICDDQPDIVSALRIYLTPEGYRFFEANTGLQALEIARREDIHLILMDVMMPEMDGVAATKAIREFSNVPIIMLTAKSEIEDKVLGLDVGAEYWQESALSCAATLSWAAGQKKVQRSWPWAASV